MGWGMTIRKSFRSPTKWSDTPQVAETTYNWSMKNASRSRFGSLVLAVCLAGTGASVLQPVALMAQASQRTVSGRVTDKSDAPMKGAIVYLKDDHTLSIKSFIADETGSFRFAQLSSTTDYELWAEHNGKKSAVKTISSFDSKTAFTINLKVDTGS